jgi:hypothetical protein
MGDGVQRIRIPAEQWGRVWCALVAAGPVSRVSEEAVYLVTAGNSDCYAARSFLSS